MADRSVLDEHPNYATVEELREQWKQGDVADLESAIQFLLKEYEALEDLLRMTSPSQGRQP